LFCPELSHPDGGGDEAAAAATTVATLETPNSFSIRVYSTCPIDITIPVPDL
jgi:hypothetical protein